MKISPEPLHPLRCWRDLWNAEPMNPQSTLRTQLNRQAGEWKQAKQPAFYWLTQLLNRDINR